MTEISFLAITMNFLHTLLIFSTLFFCLFCYSKNLSADGRENTFYSREKLSGGATSVFELNSNAFSSPVKNLTDVIRIRRFNIGDDFFENPWVGKTASTELRDGLGPLFNNNACQDCHIRDGRGHAPADVGSKKADDFSTIIFKAIRANISAEDKKNMLLGKLAGIGDSQVGSQLQQEAVFSIRQEVTLSVNYTYHNIYFHDGFPVELRRPRWSFTNNYANKNAIKNNADFDPDTLFSPRIAQPMIGLGLLELIDEASILKNHDPDDINGDNISGKANYVWHVKHKRAALGRFGWKAGQPTIRQQSAGAFNHDMGLTTDIFPAEGCLKHQHDCLASPNGNGDSRADYPFEVSIKTLDAIEFYARHLAVPARRNTSNPDVKAGKQLFMMAQCHACHSERFATSDNPALPELSRQTIYPYTDLLLHDMGENLADIDNNNRPGSADTLIEYQATAREWRTPPLWGLGLTKIVNPDAGFLHDGRARTIMEAILWHGGEAQQSVDKVLSFSRQQRKQLLSFLHDL
ncbi:MAG: c-type cytochrome [Cellvibrionaceae bacterium]|nr:c-type cytochrome [Cellvibrionaceae bacterium]